MLFRSQLVDSEKRITELDAIFKRLYEDNISGKLSDERFQKLSADYEKEEQELKVLASSLRKEVELEESKSADVDRFLSVVERNTALQNGATQVRSIRSTEIRTQRRTSC